MTTEYRYRDLLKLLEKLELTRRIDTNFPPTSDASNILLAELKNIVEADIELIVEKLNVRPKIGPQPLGGEQRGTLA